MKKYPVKTIPPKLSPRDYFNEEDKHLVEIGVRIKRGARTNVPGICEGRLYFENKEILKAVMEDLKQLGVFPVIKCGLTRIVIYNVKQFNLLRFYLKGRNIDCQGI